MPYTGKDILWSISQTSVFNSCRLNPCLYSQLAGLAAYFFFQVMGVQSDLLFPVQQQRELEELLKESGMISHNFICVNLGNIQ